MEWEGSKCRDGGRERRGSDGEVCSIVRVCSRSWTLVDAPPKNHERAVKVYFRCSAATGQDVRRGEGVLPVECEQVHAVGSGLLIKEALHPSHKALHDTHTTQEIQMEFA